MAYLNSPASTNAVIGFPHGSPDAVFLVPSPSNGACPGGDTLCFQSDDSSVDTLAQFLLSGGATVLSGSPAALSSKLNNTGFEFTGFVTAVTGQAFEADHDDGIQLKIGTTLVIDAPNPTSLSTTPAVYTGPSGTFAFDLVYGECCGGPADLFIALPFSGLDAITSVTEPASLVILGGGVVGLGILRRRRAFA